VVSHTRRCDRAAVYRVRVTPRWRRRSPTIGVGERQERDEQQPELAERGGLGNRHCSPHTRAPRRHHHLKMATSSARTSEMSSSTITRPYLRVPLVASTSPSRRCRADLLPTGEGEGTPLLQHPSRGEMCLP
jgi:hypothetical protein